MLPSGGDVVARGKFLDHFDVGGEARVGEDALEEIVAEQRVVGDAAAERGLEDVDVVDSLAVVRAFAEQILIHVGDGESVGIDTGAAGEHALEDRALAAGRQRRRDARLKHPVSFADAAIVRVEARRVQRMRHLADQAAGSVARHAGIGVKRDYVADAFGHNRGRAVDCDELVSVAPRRSRFSSCSLPRLRSHPIHFPSAGSQTLRR